MTKIATPMNVLDEVTSGLHRLYRRPFTFFSNPWQQWSFWSVIVLFGLRSLGALLFARSPWPEPQWDGWAYPTLFFALMAYGAAAVHVVASMVGPLRLLLSPARLVLEPVTEAFHGELDLIARVVHSYGPGEVAYALERLTLVATQFRARIALVVGAVDKVGMIPLAVGAYFPFRALLTEQMLTPTELSWIVGAAIGLGVLYIMGVGYLRWAQSLDDACLVLKHAMQAKLLVNLPPPSAPAPIPATALPVQDANGGSRRRRRHKRVMKS